MLGPPAHPAFDPTCLHLAADLRRLGIEPTRGAWHQVRHGVWVRADAFAAMDPLHRHAALVHASALTRRGPGELVFAREAAAALWGLPRITPWPTHVHHLVTRRGVSGATVLRPFLGTEAEPVDVDGLLVTSVARTVVDLARTGTLHDAVTAADHALRHGLCTRAELLDEATSIPARGHGRGAAGLVAELADGRSMSHGESLSRVQMFVLRLPRPELQVAFHDDLGHIGDTDFGWKGVAGEFDGRLKYRVPPGGSAQDVERVVWAEKKREDRLRRQARVARWVWAEAVQKYRLAAILAQVGITPERRSAWFDLGA
ncbi:hypothetical protein GCM10022415_32470 [Knoellia locipacati]|uniref:Transcriptional regulator, AbiEi antitoxin, Type IV TA system n=1 Tax=Knoellia locipacati TaxID=882824 RepID=A0A512T3H8_9MICO|nr:hypothetical protein [Knoellia locipacati]GEQ14749.1 hypothetical protein KLO01_27960 [Knoellia locipacati]